MFEEGPQGERPEGSAEINSGSLPVRNKVKTMKIGGICELLPPPSTSSSKLSPSRGEDNNVFGLTETILPLNSPSAKNTSWWSHHQMGCSASHKGLNVQIETAIKLHEQVLNQSTGIGLQQRAQIPSKSQRFILRVVLVLQFEHIGHNVLRSLCGEVSAVFPSSELGSAARYKKEV